MTTHVKPTRRPASKPKAAQARPARRGSARGADRVEFVRPRPVVRQLASERDHVNTPAPPHAQASTLGQPASRNGAIGSFALASAACLSLTRPAAARTPRAMPSTDRHKGLTASSSLGRAPPAKAACGQMRPRQYPPRRPTPRQPASQASTPRSLPQQTSHHLVGGTPPIVAENDIFSLMVVDIRMCSLVPSRIRPSSIWN